MVVVFKSRLLHALGVDDDDVMVKWKAGRYVRRPGDA
jgi:hypothetical protein